MGIIFLAIYPESFPSTRFRICQYFPLLEKEGIRYRFAPPLPARLFNLFYGRRERWRFAVFFLLVLCNRIRVLLLLPCYSIVVIQKGIMPFSIRGMAGLFRFFSKKLIFDMDDAVYLNADTNLPGTLSFMEDRFQVQKLIQCADTVIAGNNCLKEYAEKINKRVVVIPTSVDTDSYGKKTARMDDKKVIVGWIGSESTNIYVNMLIPVLNGLKSSFEMEFWICSSSLKKIRTECISAAHRFMKWSVESERYFLSNIDIGVMPLEDNEWERCKCGFKIIQYMACGIPVVASPVGVNVDIIKDGENGFLAKDGCEWTEKLSRLMDNKDLRERFAAAGRIKVLNCYSIERDFPLLLDVLKN